MSTLWVQVCTTLPDHPKTTALAEALNLSCAKLDGNTAATGLLIRLWTWAIQVKPDGCLTGCSPKAFAQATRFRGKPEVLVDALISTGWLDQEDGELYLHDWEQYAGLFIDKTKEKREQNRLAQQACRARKRAQRDAEQALTTPETQSQVTPQTSDFEPVLTGDSMTVMQSVIERQDDVSMTVMPCHTPTLPIHKPNTFSCAELEASSTPDESPMAVPVSGTEPQSAPQLRLEPPQPPIAELLLNDGTTFPVYPDNVEKWAERYPAVDVAQEVRNMEGWLEGNSRNRKTKNGILRFINAWLARAQNSARRLPNQPGATENTQKPPLSLVWGTNENGEEVPVCLEQ